jgi:hypothetical protein
MYDLMSLQNILPAEGFITHITRKWTVPTMHDFMSVQSTPGTAGFITQITGN